MADDPLFDPWSTDVVGAPWESPPSSDDREREAPEAGTREEERTDAGAHDGQADARAQDGQADAEAANGQTDAGQPADQPTGATGAEGSGGERAPERARPPGRPSRWRSSAAESGLQPGRPPAPARHPAPPPSASRSRRAADLADRLHALAMPLLRELATRLDIARHRTLVDDRLAQEPPTIRFRLMPWQAPFDEPTAVAGAVLELVAVSGREVAARLWLDPLAETPSEQSTVEAERLGEPWLNGVLMDFVERALRQS